MNHYNERSTGCFLHLPSLDLIGHYCTTNSGFELHSEVEQNREHKPVEQCGLTVKGLVHCTTDAEMFTSSPRTRKVQLQLSRECEDRFQHNTFRQKPVSPGHSPLKMFVCVLFPRIFLRYSYTMRFWCTGSEGLKCFYHYLNVSFHSDVSGYTLHQPAS